MRIVSRGILAHSDNAVVIGLPPEFDLRRNLEESTQIRIATAFAHWSGWCLIKDAIRNSKATVKLLTGLDFCQTKPKVLEDWLSLGACVRARIYIGDAPTFHPKVLIVTGPTGRFAVVGSANLSEAAFRNNVECSIFEERTEFLNDLEDWFDSIFENENTTKALVAEDISEYEKSFTPARNAIANLRTAQKEIESKLRESIAHWQPAKREELMDPVLRYFGNRKQASSEEIRQSILGSGRGTYGNWVDWALVDLQAAELIIKTDPEMKIYKITQEGTDLLRREPGKITLETLGQFPAYLRYRSENAKKAAETRKRNRASKDFLSTQL